MISQISLLLSLTCPHGSRLLPSFLELPLRPPDWAHCLLCGLHVVHSPLSHHFDLLNMYIRSPLPKTLPQWISTAHGIKSRLLIMCSQVGHVLTPAHLSGLSSFHFLSLIHTFPHFKSLELDKPCLPSKPLPMLFPLPGMCFPPLSLFLNVAHSFSVSSGATSLFISYSLFAFVFIFIFFVMSFH